MKKNLLPLSLLLTACFFTQTCKKPDPCEPISPQVKTPVPFTILSSNTTTEGDKECVTSEVEWGPEYPNVISLDPQGSVIYPGAILNFNSVQDGGYIPIVEDRKPITISMSLSNVSGDVSRVVEEPSLSATREAILEILKTKVSGATAASIGWGSTEVYSREHFKLAIGGNFGSLFYDVSANYEYDNTEITGRFLFELTQVYYSVDVNSPQPGMENFFEQSPDCEQTGGVSPVYVSSVQYGRKVFLLVESKVFNYSHKADINASFQGFFASGGGSVDLTLGKLLTQKSIKAVIIGGPAYEGVKVVNNVSALKDYLLAGANYSEDSPGVPLSYTLRFVDDNSIAKLVLYDKYTIRDCKIVPPSTDCFTPGPIAELTLNHVGGDKEFSSNGPKVDLTCNLSIRNNESEVWATIKVDMKETKSDYTHGSREYERLLWTCPSDKKILVISSEKTFSFSYIDEDDDMDKFDFSASKIVKRLEFLGDTQGGDLDQGDIEKEGHLHDLRFNEICVQTAPR